jgi:hypothetical protein
MDTPLPFRRASRCGALALLLSALLGIGLDLAGADEVVAIFVVTAGSIAGIVGPVPAGLVPAAARPTLRGRVPAFDRAAAWSGR